MKKRSSFINIGFSSVLVILIMICITTFAALSLVTANSDYKLSKKIADKGTSYYTADTTAKDVLKDIDDFLNDIYKSSDSETVYYDAISNRFSASFKDKGSKITYSTADKTVNYEIPMSDTQKLEVTLNVKYPQNAKDTFVDITHWKTVAENKATDDNNKINVFK